ncbi:unnamed protein product [Caretta caretta]
MVPELSPEGKTAGGGLSRLGLFPRRRNQASALCPLQTWLPGTVSSPQLKLGSKRMTPGDGTEQFAKITQNENVIRNQEPEDERHGDNGVKFSWGVNTIEVDPGTDTAFVTPASSFAEFMEKHVDNPKTTNTYSQTYCNYMMKERNMICKQKITFIPPTHLTSKTPAATEGHAHRDNYYDSKQSVSLTECHRQPPNGHRRCGYKEPDRISEIRLACVQLPVHYNKTLNAAPTPAQDPNPAGPHRGWAAPHPPGRKGERL